MTCQPKILFASAWVAGLCAATGVGVEVRVTGNHVNLRAAPGGKAEVISQVNEGDLLTVRSGLDSDWVEVAAPTSASAWVYAELVRGDVVAATKVRVRGGPNIGYRPIGRVAKGDRVTVRGREGDWLKIAPPPGTALWISRDYVAEIAKPQPEKPAPLPFVATPPPVPPVAETPAPARAESTGATVKNEPSRPVRVDLPSNRSPLAGRAAEGTARTPTVTRQVVASRLPVGLAGRTLVPSKEQGKMVTQSGVVRPSGLVWRRPSRYRLAEDASGRDYTLCYILGDEKQLRDILDCRVTIHGREYWVQGVRFSVIVPERIIRRSD